MLLFATIYNVLQRILWIITIHYTLYNALDTKALSKVLPPFFTQILSDMFFRSIPRSQESGSTAADSSSREAKAQCTLCLTVPYIQSRALCLLLHLAPCPHLLPGSLLATVLPCLVAPPYQENVYPTRPQVVLSHPAPVPSLSDETWNQMRIWAARALLCIQKRTVRLRPGSASPHRKAAILEMSRMGRRTSSTVLPLSL